MNRKTCCLTGHRPDKLSFGYDESHEDCARLKLKLAVEIEEMRKKGVTAFLTGMARGAETWGAETVLDLRRAYPDALIRLIAVIPYKRQANYWPAKDRARYQRVLRMADETVVLREDYSRRCMYERDRYMVEASGHMIAVFNGMRGGIRYTLDYAQTKGLDIAVINPDFIKKQ